MEKRTGVKVEFIHPAAGQDNEKFNLMVASGDLPDIMYRGWTAQAGGPQKMLDDKVIQPLNPLVARYAPNIKAFLDQEPAIKKMVVTDDGILYSFPIVRYKQSILAPYGWQVRGDWMEQVGLTALPETLDEWYTFLKTFKEKDPAGNGKTVPFMLYEIKHGRGPRIFLWAYGMEYGWYHADGKAKFGAYEPAFKDYLTRMAQWYKEGLIVKEFATIATNTPYDSKVANNEAAGWFGGLGDTMGRFIAAYKKDPSSKFYVRPIAAPTLKKGEKGWNFSFDTITTGQGAAISTRTKYPKEATKWLDYHYSPEGHLMMNFGVDGVSYRLENGKPVLTDEILKNPKGYSIDVALGQYTQGASGEAQILDAVVRQYRMWSMPVQREASLLWNGDQGPKRQMPPITLTSAEASKFTSKMNDVWTLTHEATTKFIMGQKPISEYEAFVAQLKSIGIDELIAMQQAALDRYNKR